MRNTPETITYVRKFVADMNDMGRPHCFRTDIGGEFTSRDYVVFCYFAGVRRKYTALVKLKQNAVVENVICRVKNGGYAARRKIQRIFQRRSGANLQDRSPAVTVCGWRLFVGLMTAFTDRRPRPTPGGARRTRFSTRDYRF